ncbi:glycosyltransferase, MGT family [Sphingomonas palmae]|uniref:Glycosyltransferase, MGT family n=1 Tax=Sphingomonas palmae TaxID=1855283 RepID=A0A1H7SYL9_9SPHN|nr:glycosyltransferase [Sphingomonas palmae]SEL77084.1 glycosyltransferase, MGT family [Sphingomonas palmae]
MPSVRRHIAIVAPPTAGHLNPLQVLGRELSARGHRVSLVHVDGVERFVSDPSVGFHAIPGTSAPMLDAYLDLLGRPTGPRGLPRMIAATAQMTAQLLDGVPAVLERIGAEAVIADTAEPAGALIAARMRLPLVASVTGLPLLREEDVPPPFLGWRFRPDAVGRNRNNGGYQVADLLLRPITRVLDETRRTWGLGPEGEPLAWVAQCPRALDYPRARLPATFSYGGPWRGPEEGAVDLPHDDERPLVFCSLGTLQGSRRALFAVMARACALAGARAVIGHGGGLSPAGEAALPGDPLVRAFWPQAAVLRHCAAAVLHGGFNTVLDALAAGVPIVALPIAFEQPGTAARVAWSGAGRVLSPRALRASTLAAVLGAVIHDPGYRDAARRIGAEMAQSGGATAAAARVSAALA